MKRTIEADLLTDIMLMVFRINGRLLDGGDRLGAALNLTSARWQVLGAISLSSGPVTVPGIAEMMGMTRQGAQKQVNKLEEDGFIEKRANPRHQRVSIGIPVSHHETNLSLKNAGCAAYAAGNDEHYAT